MAKPRRLRFKDMGTKLKPLLTEEFQATAKIIEKFEVRHPILWGRLRKEYGMKGRFTARSFIARTLTWMAKRGECDQGEHISAPKDWGNPHIATWRQLKRILLPPTRIGKLLTIGCELEEDEVGLCIASQDLSLSCALKFDEWAKFVEGVNQANTALNK